MGKLASFSAVFAAALAVTAACSQAVPDEPSSSVTRQTEDLFDTLARMELSAQPELVTMLGFPAGRLDPRENMVLGDRSQAAFERLRLRRIEVLKYQESTPLAPEGSALRRDQEAVLRTYTHTVAVAEFGHGWIGLGNAYPYVLDHRRGAWIDVPALLMSRQSVDSRLEASEYISRLTALGGAIDDERLRLLADADAGILPPEPILIRLSTALEGVLETADPAQPVLIAFDNLLTGVDDLSSEDRAELNLEAELAFEKRVRPAYERLADTVELLSNSATEIPGVWSFPRGDGYYDAVLAMHVGAGTSAESLHRQARARVDTLTQALNEELTFLGWAQGSVGARLEALALDAFQALPETDEGRAELETLLATQLAQVQRLDGWIARQPDLPIALETIDGPPGFARYFPPPADRSRPARFQVDTSNVSAWPRFSLAALVLHESVPGHHTEASFAMETAGLPLIRQLIWNTGYGEGWASYAETLALDARLYDDDPYARVGILQSQLFHAARAVADTGIHRMRWTREETLDYLISTTGLAPSAMEETVDRIMVWPGQATSYMAGSVTIEDLRERAEAVIGPNFDVAAFHFTLLEGGPRPLVQVRADIERWYEAQLGAAN
ncbi:MAG: DUF885 domain-containing protein [Pseudomonadota bacterium]